MCLTWFLAQTKYWVQVDVELCEGGLLTYFFLVLLYMFTFVTALFYLIYIIISFYFPAPELCVGMHHSWVKSVRKWHLHWPRFKRFSAYATHPWPKPPMFHLYTTECILGCAFGGIYVPVFTCMPGGVTIGDSGRCVPCLFSSVKSLCWFWVTDKKYLGCIHSLDPSGTVADSWSVLSQPAACLYSHLMSHFSCFWIHFPELCLKAIVTYL